LGEPAKALEKAIKSGTLDHSGDPVLAWCLENVEVKTDDNGNIRPVKPSHGSQKKVDAVSALLNAIQRMIAAPAPRTLTADKINL
jgi:phage terminase large subunit-like protein